METTLKTIVDNLARQNHGGIQFAALDGCIRLGDPKQYGWDERTAFFHIRDLAGHLTAGAPWLKNLRPPDGDWGYPRIQDDVQRMLTDLVDPESWRDNGGTVGAVRELGDVLVITQTPRNLAAVQPMIDAVNRAAADDAPFFQAVRPIPAKQNSNEVLFYSILLPPLIQKLQLPSSPMDNAKGEDPIFDVLRQFELLVCFTCGLQSEENQVVSTSHIAGKLLLLNPSANPDGIQPLLDAILRAADAADLSPIMVAPTRAQVEAASGKTQALFNVRAVMAGLKARRARHPIPTPPALPKTQRSNVVDDFGLQKYILSHVDRAKWDGAGGGVFYSMGAVLGVTQTPENIEAVHRALGQLARELAADGKQ